VVSQTVFHSDETFTQESFQLWLDERPAVLTGCDLRVEDGGAPG